MKINEINQPKQIDEGIGSALIGDRAASAIRGFFSGKGTKQTMAQKAFLKDFYQDAITSLDNGINGGFINQNLTSNLAQGDTDTNDDTEDDTDSKTDVKDPSKVQPKPGEPGAPAAGPGAAAAKANKAQQQTTQTINNYIKNAAKTINSTTDKRQKIALTKELVNAMADRKGYPEWENALATVQQVIKRGNVDPNFATTAINNLKAGKTMAEAYKIYYINMLVESVGLTWNDLGLCVFKKNNHLYLAEQKYLRMDNLFESIMSLKENEGGISIGQYMLDWFNAYMQNTKWESYKAQVLPMIQQIEDTYPKGHKNAINQLAKTALSISKLSPIPPKGAENIIPDQNKDGSQGENPIGSALKKLGGGTEQEKEEQIKAIAKNNPELVKKVAAELP
jgi:hypothetical protein